MKKFLRLLSSLLAATTLGAMAAVPSPSEEPKAKPRPAPLVDRDQNGISDGLQARVREAGPSDRFQVVVTFKGPGDAASARAQVGNFELRREFRIVRGFAATMTAAQISALAQRAGVFRIEEDFQVTAKLETARTDFGASAAQLLGYSGAGVKVCVVDTGVDRFHEQFNDRTITFHDFVGTASEAYDDHGHGTHVAGIAAGEGTGGADAFAHRGVAPGVQLYAAKVLDSAGSGDSSQVEAGIEWCVVQGVDVISISIGGGASDGLDAMSQAVNAAVDAGVAVVVAAGNSGDGEASVTTPGTAEKAITVGAAAEYTGASNGIHLTPWSSRGPNLAGLVKPDVVSPGDTISSADNNTGNPGIGYVAMSGTSMATPFVSGAVALALQANPGLSPAQLKQKLGETAQDRGVSGQDNDWGWGLLDVHAFVRSANGDSGPEAWPFPSHDYIAGSVPNFGLWSHTFEVTDRTTPIAATVIVNGELSCVVPWPFGGCLIYGWGPDLEARIKAPNGTTLVESRCPGIPGPAGCGQLGRQETPRVMPTMTGTYRVEVYPDPDGSGAGGNFTVELSTGPVSSAPPPPINTAPVADNDSYAVNEDATLTMGAPGVLEGDTDANGDSLRTVLVSGPSHGSVTLSPDGSFTYRPNSNFNGSDSFTYTANDGTADSNVATVNIAVNAVNDAPVASNDSYTVRRNRTLTVGAPGVLGNDSDPDGGALTAQLISRPTNGTFGWSGNGGFTYTPPAGWSGTVSFTYRASDGVLQSGTATGSIRVRR